MKLAPRNYAQLIIVFICSMLLAALLYRSVTDENSSLYYILSIDRSFYRSDRTDAFIYASLPTDSLIRIIEKNNDWKKYPRDSIAQNLRNGKYTAALAALACKSDKTAISKLTEILKQDPRHWSALKYIAKSRNVAMTKCLCDILMQMEDAPVRYPQSHTDKILISTLIELDDPSALDCFSAIKEKKRFKSEFKQIEEAISRWKDMTSGRLDPAYSAPFEYGYTRNSQKNDINVSSFGGYSFNVGKAWAWNMAIRDNQGVDHFEFTRSQHGSCPCATRLEICITHIANKDAPPIKDFNEYIQEKRFDMGFDKSDLTKPYSIKTIDVNGNPCTVAELKFVGTRNDLSETCQFCIFYHMRIGTMEIYGLLFYNNYQESPHDIHNVNELLEILKSFKFDTRWRKSLWASRGG